ncbi:MAG: sugar phosphate nucleotidyltransferase [Candidatus Pacebacteria bacterium]|nr:sugar phosphate nucleotidyltransferase [Candidatus Paceibacterota bacterium]MDD3072299.1 sugar phosphate nucleotidyltransferase [Candidatus Paceibacterota bacterium]MDD3728885.1 sugar phosphate nucleotidyltransferase [Candidatus Paceibacterota bacterium]MDD4201458.1 sugar phosphate nucleotidyltransferase [Candidatus Paceibacterota bacterium]MDD4897311.1 sugar phosphate nucleotidyltransferase [Candidatus Paceibacterota bacterium]
MTEIKKAVILLAGLGTRFLPLSKIVPKEFWPLVDKPVIQYILEEAINSGIKEIIFVIRQDNRLILEYTNYKKTFSEVEKVLRERKEEKILEDIKKLENLFKEVTFSYVFQKNPLGDGQAVLETKKAVKDDPVAILFADDVIKSKVPALSQLISVFNTSQKTTLSLFPLQKEKLSSYGVVNVERIANKHYKILGIVEKPSFSSAPSNLAVVGKYIIIPEVFDYLKKTKPTAKKEIILANAFSDMLRDKKTIYGKEIEGEWLECGNKLALLKSNIILSLEHPEYGEELKKTIKDLKV